MTYVDWVTRNTVPEGTNQIVEILSEIKSELRLIMILLEQLRDK